MRFILSDENGERQERRLRRQVRSWQPIGDLDRSCFDSWRAFDEVEIPVGDLCISFYDGGDVSEVEEVPRIWSLPSNF